MERKNTSDYPQELLDLFHEYQHGDLSRRSFLDRAGKFAVGGVTAATIFASLRPNYAWAQQVPRDDKRLKVSTETVASPQGNGSIKGYFVRPANATGKLPAVLVVHENRGLNPYFEDVARRALAHGARRRDGKGGRRRLLLRRGSGEQSGRPDSESWRGRAVLRSSAAR